MDYQPPEAIRAKESLSEHLEAWQRAFAPDMLNSFIGDLTAALMAKEAPDAIRIEHLTWSYQGEKVGVEPAGWKTV